MATEYTSIASDNGISNGATNGIKNSVNKWWLSTTLLFTVSFIAYLAYCVFVNLAPNMEIILVLVTAYSMSSGYRKLSVSNGNGKTV